jgi:putative ABC transport system substrate-binding protein
MRRREFVTLLGGAAAAWPLAARAQEPAVPVIGFLSLEGGARQTPFLQGLSEAGYVEGQNVTIEYGWAENYDRMPALAAELVRRRVAVIYANNAPAALAAKAATSTIPIVFNVGSDPVKDGLVTSFNRPGGNITGVTVTSNELEGKRLGLLHELVPATERIAALVNPKNSGAETQLTDLPEAARRVGRQIEILHATTEREIDQAFTSLVQHRAGALIVASDLFFYSRRNQIVALAAHYAIPTIYHRREFAEAGGLASYGTDFPEMGRQSGIYVGRVLKGERPAVLPVVQPIKFELVINLKTAKALGLAVPPTVLARADDVIE